VRLPYLAAAITLAACAELGVVSDGTSISVGKPNHGYLIDGVRLPDSGEGYTTRDVWLKRDNRYATDELVDLVIGVARRMRLRVPDTRLVIGDLSARAGGAERQFHRSHQSGRDADFLFYMRGPDGKPFEPDAMHAFDARGNAIDHSGITIDVPRTWSLVRELIDAPEAPVQYIFIYEPIALLVLDHAKQIGEPDDVLARARKALRQPGDSARHDDHMHVRVYCARDDRAYGCIDIGPMDLLAEREARATAVETGFTPATPAAASAAPSGFAGWRLGLDPLLLLARPDRTVAPHGH
jgi:penicillin-insensitive murein endopeptidase